jgi:hypothetical protein
MFAARKTDGAATAAAANYIEDVFSTYLYTGNGSVQTIPNGIAIGDDSGGSVYFGGTGYLQTPSALLSSSSSFTFECWAYWNSTGSSADMGMLTSQYASGGAGRFLFGSQSGALVLRVNGGTVYLTTSVSTGIWYHIAWTFDGTTHRLFKDGVLSDSSTTVPSLYTGANTSLGGQSDTLLSGYKLNGFISNARILSGTALYTSGFTPPTAPLTAITNTSLLTCQTPNTILDYSTNAYTITVNGNAVAQNGGGPFTDSTANKGGMVWLKGRSGATDHALYDTNRGATFDLGSNLSTAQTTQTTGLTSFNSNGFSIGSLAKLNTNAATYTSWTFRKQAKFFDVVTWTGDGTGARNVSHNLGATPGCMVYKPTSITNDWIVWHRTFSDPSGDILRLNLTDAKANSSGLWGSGPTSTTIPVDSFNVSGRTYVAYLFAHDAGGFGPAGTDNVISCGTFTGVQTVTLGYEPQWLLIKRTDAAENWWLYDTMRGWTASGSDQVLVPNATTAETNYTNNFVVTATGFVTNSASTGPYIYIAIRRGPMKTPTSGTSVYGNSANTSAIDASNAVVFNPEASDLWFNANRGGGIYVLPKLNGWRYLVTHTTANENTSYTWEQRTQTDLRPTTTWWGAGQPQVNWFFKRAPGFFDIVCDTGTGVAKTVTHNLTVVPELMIRKKRNSATNSDWVVWHTAFTGTTKYLYLNSTAAEDNNSAFWTSTAPTSSVFSLGNGSRVNNSGDTYVTYLFASVNGVSKVGSYTGNGSSQTINCGFTAGARFILIKRTSSTGDWYVWDTARGIVAGNDPRLSLNNGLAEVTTDDSVDPDNSGFIVNQLSATNINVNAATYIYLAIA